MKKLIYGVSVISIISLLSFSYVAFAKVDRVPGPWNLVGNYTIDFTCTSGCGGDWFHSMNITSDDLATGIFSGAGSWDGDPSNYTWDVTGIVSGNNVLFTIVYTGANAGYTVNANGTIAFDGTMSGTAEGLGQIFSWKTTDGSATRFEGNHGQYVSSQSDKQEAAQSRIGMPVQSQGHN